MMRSLTFDDPVDGTRSTFTSRRVLRMPED